MRVVGGGRYKTHLSVKNGGSACLKTAIGLITACAETFKEMFPRTISYKAYVVVFSVLTTLVANVGLTNIIAYSLPVLMFLYPLAITLILLALLSPLFKDRQVVYVYEL